MKWTFYFLLSCISFWQNIYAQAANEIVDIYIERSGGRVAWDTLRTIQMDATVKLAGVALPISIYNTNTGKQAIMVDYNDKRFAQLAFDGETYWTTDPRTMTPRIESPEVTANVKKTINDFPSPLINYEKNYYQLEYDGIVTVDSMQTFKIRIIKDPIKINGQEVENISYYYFDTNNYRPVKVEEMQPTGKVETFRLSDYQQVEAYTFPFTIARDTTVVEIKSISLNPSIDGDIFEFPAIEE